MTNLKLVEPMPKTLDRDAWHKPLVSIIVTHHNYSAHLEDALLSLLDQSHERWECVVVDDGSDDTHRGIADLTVATIGDDRIRFHPLEKNRGQIPAFFSGLEVTTGAFACLLDPDDRYAETFLERALAAHLNPVRYGPIVSTDQYLLKDGALLTGCYTGHKARDLAGAGEIPQEMPGRLLYFPAARRGWHWSSTSGAMFRRAALNFLRPVKPLAYKGSADSYLFHGCHYLGGSLFLTEPLIYRGVHDDNAYLTSSIYAMGQGKRKINGEARTAECIVDVMEAIRINGAGEDLGAPASGKRTLPQRLRRSMEKRWRRWLGRAA
jgi:glycosyltransferase involved in cell wall biosynthesis